MDPMEAASRTAVFINPFFQPRRPIELPAVALCWGSGSTDSGTVSAGDLPRGVCPRGSVAGAALAATNWDLGQYCNCRVWHLGRGYGPGWPCEHTNCFGWPMFSAALRSSRVMPKIVTPSEHT